jgi:hypothetical protein
MAHGTWHMALHYQPAQLHGGPLDGDVVQAPLREDQSIPVRVIGVPVPVLDERTETFWWDTGNYFCAAGANAGHRPGEPWHYHFARTLAGYPTFTEDADR